MIISILIENNPLFFEEINNDFNISKKYDSISFDFNQSTNDVYIKLNDYIYTVEGKNCPIKKIYKKKNNLEIIFLKESTRSEVSWSKFFFIFKGIKKII